MKPTWRKPVGVLALLAALAAYVGLVASALDRTTGWPLAAQLVAYVLAGTAWLLPLRPFLIWMETGHWR
jgi:hypothetical protein